MPDSPEGMIPVEDFSKSKDISNDEVIKMIRDGFYVGRKINDSWFISISELSDNTKKCGNVKRTHKHRNKLFNTPIDKLYTICSVIVLMMIVFPPVYSHSEGTSVYKGYKFLFDMRYYYFIDFGRLSLQFIALGSVAIIIKRLINKT